MQTKHTTETACSNCIPDDETTRFETCRRRQKSINLTFCGRCSVIYSVIRTNKMHFSLLIYFNNHPLHVSNRLTIHHQEVQGKVKCTLVQALRLCTGRTAHRGSRGIALLFLVHGTGRGWGVSVTLRPLFTPWKDPVPIGREAEWAPGPYGQVRKISSPPGFDPEPSSL